VPIKSLQVPGSQTAYCFFFTKSSAFGSHSFLSFPLSPALLPTVPGFSFPGAGRYFSQRGGLLFLKKANDIRWTIAHRESD
jgi:hypothetical protein